MSIKDQDAREREEWQDFLRRKAARKAGNSAAAIPDTTNTTTVSGKTLQLLHSPRLKLVQLARLLQTRSNS